MSSKGGFQKIKIKKEKNVFMKHFYHVKDVF